MKTFLLHLWAKLRTSFWFIPGLLVTIAAILGFFTVQLDRNWSSEFLADLPHLRNASPEGVRSLLSTAATAVLTLAGITFSSTLVALTLASSQYGGRLLRNFIRALPNQISLGILLGNFTFCLIVLRSVRSLQDGEFIPHLAALIAFIGTIGSLVTFIYFIHHIATSLQADSVISGVYGELDEAIERHFPDERPKNWEEEKANEEKREWENSGDEIVINSLTTGCIQAVAINTLVEECARLDLRCRVLHRPGHFVNAGTGLLAVGGSPSIEAQDREKLRAIFIIGPVRTAEQDFEYCIRQLVEVSLRALSPGINDPFTAMNCIDYLGAALAKVARRKLPPRHFSDGAGTLRVRTRPTLFGDLLDAAFHQIRQTANGKTDITLRLLGSLGGIGASVMLVEHGAQVIRHAELIADAGFAGTQADCDRQAIEEALASVRERLNVKPE